jgi:hypothetical protein
MGHEIIFISLDGPSICFLCKWMGHETHIACSHSIHTITTTKCCAEWLYYYLKKEAETRRFERRPFVKS